MFLKKNRVLLLRYVEIQEHGYVGIFEKTKQDKQVLAERKGATGDITKIQKDM